VRITDDGLLEGGRFIASPNCDARPVDAQVELIVIHNISLPPGEFGGPAILDLFLNRLDPAAHAYYADIAHLRLSAHFLIRRDGEIVQFVPCTQRAWHAGVSQWRGRERCNDFSVGIELEGTDEISFEDAQYACLAGLIEALKARYTVVDVTGHSDIAPGRKTDPGVAFDWSRINSV
jgi:AmpD protein